MFDFLMVMAGPAIVAAAIALVAWRWMVVLKSARWLQQPLYMKIGKSRIPSTKAQRP